MFELRDYQKPIADKGLKILQEHKLLYLTLETRLGKTLTSMTIAERFGAKNALFLTKKKAITSIQKDYKLGEFIFDITVTNYEQAKNMVGIDYDLLILDEAHCLGAYPKKSARVKTIKQMTRNVPIIYLSATPTPESFSQIYHQLYLSSWSPFSAYTSFYKWAKKFVNIRDRKIGGRTIKDYSKASKEMIEPFLNRVSLSLTQEEAGFTEKVEERFLSVEMNSTTKMLAKTLANERYFKGDAGEIVCDTPVKLQSKIHQICSGSVKLEDGTKIILDESKAAAIKNHAKGKFAIYYKFTSERDILMRHFDNITEDPIDFEESDDKVFISQVVSGREGIKLASADFIYMFNIDFSFLSYEQTRNRLQDYKREKPPVLYWVFSDIGLEKKVYKTVMSKKRYTSYHFKRDFL